MDYISKAFEYGLRHIFEPGLYWVLNHPLISVVVVGVLVYWAVRGYRML